jgi:anti-sigma regulatory factor (Ser/Thr protein kinase)
VLIAKLKRIPEDHRIAFTLEPEYTAVRHARSLIRDPLKRWGLEDLIDSSELLVSELVTNAIKYAKGGEILLRLILEPDTLVCEVHDSSPALPRVLQVDKDAENGRGLHVVSQLSNRWGARRAAAGKIVWCEQLVPEEITEILLAEQGLEKSPAEPIPLHLTPDLRRGYGGCPPGDHRDLRRGYGGCPPGDHRHGRSGVSPTRSGSSC